MDGTIVNIQRFSVHDGPGIRTTVFLKGCPLRCRWCHNPESHLPQPQQGWLQARCTLCGRCLPACPVGALTLAEGRICCDRSRCASCFACVAACPAGARKIYGERMSSRAVVNLALRDRAYYVKSGGGVTISGGEPLMQADFAVETARLLKESGLHVAVETSMFGKWTDIERLREWVDLFLMDIKAMDDAVHRLATGASNELILRNIERLSALGAEGLIRIPVVVGVNACEENMRSTARFLLDKTRYRTVELLKMHKLAGHKYASLDVPYEIEDVSPPDDPLMQRLSEVLEECGIAVKR